MKDLLGSGILDARDMTYWEGLALLLGALRTERERDRFGNAYRHAATDDDAEEALAGLLDVASRLWGREGRPTGSRAPGREQASAA